MADLTGRWSVAMLAFASSAWCGAGLITLAVLPEALERTVPSPLDLFVLYRVLIRLHGGALVLGVGAMAMALFGRLGSLRRWPALLMILSSAALIGAFAVCLPDTRRAED